MHCRNLERVRARRSHGGDPHARARRRGVELCPAAAADMGRERRRERWHGRGVRALRRDGVHRRRLRLHGARDGQRRLARAGHGRAHTRLADRRRRRLRGRSGRARRLVHRRRLRVRRHAATPTTSPTSRATARSTPTSPRARTGRSTRSPWPHDTVRGRLFDAAGGQPRAKLAGFDRATGAVTGLQPRREPAPSRSSRCCGSPARRSTWAAPSPASASRRARTSAR